MTWVKDNCSSETQQMPENVGFGSQPNLRNIFFGLNLNVLGLTRYKNSDTFTFRSNSHKKYEIIFQ